jgi:hypothetical protein
MSAIEKLNVVDSPASGSRSVDCFEKLQQIGEGTHGSVLVLLSFLFLILFHKFYLYMFQFHSIVYACSQVYMAREIKTGEIVALKKIRMDNKREGV